MSKRALFPWHWPIMKHNATLALTRHSVKRRCIKSPVSTGVHRDASQISHPKKAALTRRDATHDTPTMTHPYALSRTANPQYTHHTAAPTETHRVRNTQHNASSVQQASLLQQQQHELQRQLQRYLRAGKSPSQFLDQVSTGLITHPGPSTLFFCFGAIVFAQVGSPANEM